MDKASYKRKLVPKRMSLNDRDRGLIKFLWKWRLSTTYSLYRKFFDPCKFKTAYNRLYQLKMKNYITVNYNESRGRPLWMLTKKGFKLAKEFYPELKEDGFKSDKPEHDLIVMAFHLGEFLLGEPNHIKLITDQQLRRYHLEFLPRWLPSPERYRPDGYWYIKNDNRDELIALEVELNRKTSSSYEKVANFYRTSPRISSVLWLVPDLSMAKNLLKKMTKSDTSKSDKHSFFLLKEFQEVGWQSQVMVGANIGRTVRDLICGECDDSELIPKYQFNASSLLDTGLSTTKSII